MALYIVYPECRWYCNTRSPPRREQLTSYFPVVLNSLLAKFNGRTSLHKNAPSITTAQHADLGSPQTRRGVHAKGQVRTFTAHKTKMMEIYLERTLRAQTNDINIVELGVLDGSTTTQGSDVCVVEQVSRGIRSSCKRDSASDH